MLSDELLVTPANRLFGFIVRAELISVWMALAAAADVVAITNSIVTEADVTSAATAEGSTEARVAIACSRLLTTSGV